MQRKIAFLHSEKRAELQRQPPDRTAAAEVARESGKFETEVCSAKLPTNNRRRREEEKEMDDGVVNQLEDTGSSV